MYRMLRLGLHQHKDSSDIVCTIMLCMTIHDVIFNSIFNPDPDTLGSNGFGTNNLAEI